MALRTQLIFWICAIVALTACGKEPTAANISSADITVVSSCGVINSGGEFELAEGFSGPPEDSTEPCITVAASAVVLDCQDMEIHLGGTAVGVRVDASVTDVTVKNCTVSGGEAGIAIYTRSTNNTVEGNTLYGNVHGIGLLHDTPGNSIVNNESYDNASCGIYLESATDNIFEGNMARNNGRCGLAVLPSPPGEGPDPSGNVFSSNRLLNNTSYGVIIASELVATNNMADNEFAGNSLEDFFTPPESDDLGRYIGVDEPAPCSNP